MQLLQDLARAYQALTQFECQYAIELFNSLPARHYNTGWVLCNVARAYFELCDYRQVTALSGYFSSRLIISLIETLLGKPGSVWESGSVGEKSLRELTRSQGTYGKKSYDEKLFIIIVMFGAAPAFISVVFAEHF